MDLGLMDLGLDLPGQQDLVNGAWVEPLLDGAPLCHPDTGRVFARAATTRSRVLGTAMGTAERDSPVHRRDPFPMSARVELLTDLADRLADQVEPIALADAIDSGVPIAVTRLFARGLPDVVHAAIARSQDYPWDRALRTPAGDARLLTLPWGPAVVLAPFNAPAFTAVKKSAFAIAAGCPVVLKPSPHAPHSASLLAALIQAVIADQGAPTSTFQLVHGDHRIGRRLARDRRIRCLTFTGSRAGGRAVAASASVDLKPMQLECGSNNPVIVRADASIEQTADALVSGFTKLNGQWCERPATAFVAGAIHDQLVEALIARIRRLRIGSCLDPEVEFGPQANAIQTERLDAAILDLERRGARIIRPIDVARGDGYLRAPVIITDVDPNLTKDELFGPTLVVHRVRDDVRALGLIHRLETGLAGYVFTEDPDAGIEIGSVLPVGEVKINGTSVLDLHPDSEQGFWGGSGVGSHGDAALLRFFTGTRIVGPELAGRPL